MPAPDNRIKIIIAAALVGMAAALTHLGLDSWAETVRSIAIALGLAG